MDGTVPRGATDQAALRWVDYVPCRACHNGDYRVVGGVWTCTCGSPMAVAEIAEYHHDLEKQ